MKIGKRLMVITMLTAVVLAGTSIISSKASEIHLKKEIKKEPMIELSSSCDLYEEIFKGYNQGTKGPMSITKGILDYKNINVQQDVYVVCLAGTEDVEGQSTTWLADFQSAFGLSSDYMYNTKNHMIANIPKGSNVILTGHSLGGMVAQQLSSDYFIKEQFNVLRTITFGAPLVSPSNKEGVVRRFVATQDVIPALSVSAIVEKVAQKYEHQVQYANSNDCYDSIYDIHIKAYGNENIWQGYDFLGKENGNTSFCFYKRNQRFYHCPIIE